MGHATVGHLGDGLIAEGVDAYAADRSGAFPAYDRAAKTFTGLECLPRSCSADEPCDFANQFGFWSGETASRESAASLPCRPVPR